MPQQPEPQNDFVRQTPQVVFLIPARPGLAGLREFIRRPPLEFHSFFDWLKPTNGRITDLSRIASFFRNAWLLGPSGGHFHCCFKPHPRASFLVWVVGWWSLGGQKQFFLGGGAPFIGNHVFQTVLALRHAPEGRSWRDSTRKMRQRSKPDEASVKVMDL